MPTHIPGRCAGGYFPCLCVGEGVGVVCGAAHLLATVPCGSQTNATGRGVSPQRAVDVLISVFRRSTSHTHARTHTHTHTCARARTHTDRLPQLEIEMTPSKSAHDDDLACARTHAALCADSRSSGRARAHTGTPVQGVSRTWPGLSTARPGPAQRSPARPGPA